MKSVLWRMGEECGVLYTEDRQLLRQLLAPGKLPAKQEADAATYTNARGKVFAWQITFALSAWRQIVRTVGREAVEVQEEATRRSRPAPRAEKPAATVRGRSTAPPAPAPPPSVRPAAGRRAQSVDSAGASGRKPRPDRQNAAAEPSRAASGGSSAGAKAASVEPKARVNEASGRKPRAQEPAATVPPRLPRSTKQRTEPASANGRTGSDGQGKSRAKTASPAPAKTDRKPDRSASPVEAAPANRKPGRSKAPAEVTPVGQKPGRSAAPTEVAPAGRKSASPTPSTKGRTKGRGRSVV